MASPDAYTNVSIRKPVYERMAQIVAKYPSHYASVPDLIGKLFEQAFPNPDAKPILVPVSAAQPPAEGSP